MIETPKRPNRAPKSAIKMGDKSLKVMDATMRQRMRNDSGVSCNPSGVSSVLAASTEATAVAGVQRPLDGSAAGVAAVEAAGASGWWTTSRRFWRLISANTSAVRLRFAMRALARAGGAASDIGGAPAGGSDCEAVGVAGAARAAAGGLAVTAAGGWWGTGQIGRGGGWRWQ
ncbi:hypothetical protein PR002_g1428 [Phytophthora rubi]|uniref:Uncharacterized protein n=2 Tax=Phytophthora rubi TaxID=129364 RepID=A0A6A3NUT9_9STRA|nr:hypothetical protein PR002_g1428 [Phytophthora rubi]